MKLGLVVRRVSRLERKVRMRKDAMCDKKKKENEDRSVRGENVWIWKGGTRE